MVCQFEVEGLQEALLRMCLVQSVKWQEEAWSIADLVAMVDHLVVVGVGMLRLVLQNEMVDEHLVDLLVVVLNQVVVDTCSNIVDAEDYLVNQQMPYFHQ